MRLVHSVAAVAASICLAFAACGGGTNSAGTNNDNTATSGTDGTSSDGTVNDSAETDTATTVPPSTDPEDMRNLYYLTQRVCPDGTPCAGRSDACGGDPCIDLSPDAAVYDPENPPAPEDAGPAVEPYTMRWAPLCDDGSGDHEWTLDHTQGTPPTCEKADYVRCSDGSRPLYWADKAAIGNAPDGVERWMIWAGDGGGWSPGPDAQAPLETDNFKAMIKDSNGNGSAHAPFEVRGLQGVLTAVSEVPSPLPSTDKLPSQAFFALYTHRVFIDKCSTDTWLGTSKAEFPAPAQPFISGIVPTAAGDHCSCCQAGAADCEDDPSCGCTEVRMDYPADGYRVYYHGRRVISAVLTDLSREGGITVYGSYSLDAETEVLPRLDNAASEQVVFASGSNGSHGHYHRIDSLAARLDNADVRGIMGQYFPPRIEVEHALSRQAGAVVTDNTRSVYDHVVTGTSLTGFELTLDTLRADGGTGVNYAEWGVDLDASCLAAAQDTPDAQALCRDAVHVALNHITTPLWVYMSQNDAILNASSVIFHSPHCKDADGPTACDYTDALPLPAWRTAVRKQLADLATRNHLAEGADHSRLMVFSPDVLKHGGVGGDETFNYTVGRWKQGDLMVAWLTDQVKTGYCLKPWPNGEAMPGGSNEELTGSANACELKTMP